MEVCTCGTLTGPAHCSPRGGAFPPSLQRICWGLCLLTLCPGLVATRPEACDSDSNSALCPLFTVRVSPSGRLGMSDMRRCVHRLLSETLTLESFLPTSMLHLSLALGCEGCSPACGLSFQLLHCTCFCLGHRKSKPLS